ncbi:hypothetical protein RND71_038058 [Anisodus tanguticus]|uniref:UBN2_2 domain-containing protein n=1 Tax=Anisodus tanguticus TaxID=243964 RepID=A0AAE1R1Z1_9SOLA|nr:hypothetical protein RND71_038058 [Anisodus tanguticus]
MDIDYAIRKDKSPINELSTQAEIALHEQWQCSNHLSVMFIKTKISVGICGYVEQYDNVMALLKDIHEQFKTSDKALDDTLIMKFSSMRFTGLRGVREHIMKMRDLAAQLKTLKVEMSEIFLVHYILNSLPIQYDRFKFSYNTHKDNGLLMNL